MGPMPPRSVRTVFTATASPDLPKKCIPTNSELPVSFIEKIPAGPENHSLVTNKHGPSDVAGRIAPTIAGLATVTSSRILTRVRPTMCT